MNTICPTCGAKAAVSPEEFARRVLALPAEDMTWIIDAMRRMADGAATIEQLKAELAQHKARRDGMGEGL